MTTGQKEKNGDEHLIFSMHRIAQACTKRKRKFSEEARGDQDLGKLRKGGGKGTGKRPQRKQHLAVPQDKKTQIQKFPLLAKLNSKGGKESRLRKKLRKIGTSQPGRLSTD